MVHGRRRWQCTVVDVQDNESVSKVVRMIIKNALSSGLGSPINVACVA